LKFRNFAISLNYLQSGVQNTNQQQCTSHEKENLWIDKAWVSNLLLSFTWLIKYVSQSETYFVETSFVEKEI